MNEPSLKAREIEALTFICPAEAHPSVPKHARLLLRGWRTTVGVAGLAVLIGALAWFLLLT
jgi:hypothetical protein